MGIEFIKKWTKTKVYHKRKKDLIHRTKFLLKIREEHGEFTFLEKIK